MTPFGLHPQALYGCFVSCTDTGAGKTHVGAELLHRSGQQGWRSEGLKPVTASTTLTDSRLMNAALEEFRQASSVRLTKTKVGTLQFDSACSLAIAAILERQLIDPATILSASPLCDQLRPYIRGRLMRDSRTRLGRGRSGSSRRLASDIGSRLCLGCISHMLLTTEATRARGLLLAGWITNAADPDMAYSVANLASLHREMTRRHQTPSLGLIPWVDTPPVAVAAHLDAAAVKRVFTAPRFLSAFLT
jgi:dethiobiotin synthetase